MRPIQPYQQGLPTNVPGPAQQAMQRGRTLYNQNPADMARAMGAIPGSLRWWLIVNGAGMGQQNPSQARWQPPYR